MRFEERIALLVSPLEYVKFGDNSTFQSCGFAAAVSRMIHRTSYFVSVLHDLSAALSQREREREICDDAHLISRCTHKNVDTSTIITIQAEYLKRDLFH